MMGLMFLVAMGIYALVTFGVVYAAVAYARKTGGGTKRWGFVVLLVMYLIPFWDWLPTVAMHKFNCSNDSGFWIYKTLDQWKIENPGVMETLTTQRVWPSQHIGDVNNYVATSTVNQRFKYVRSKNDSTISKVWRHEKELLDSNTGTVIAKQIDFSTGNGNIGGGLEVKFWMHRDNCNGGRENAINFVKFFNQFKGVEK
jgi:hypothetical protein